MNSNNVMNKGVSGFYHIPQDGRSKGCLVEYSSSLEEPKSKVEDLLAKVC